MARKDPPILHNEFSLASRQVQTAYTPSLRRARVAVFIIFLVTGATFTTWASHIPTLSSQLHLSAGALGTAFFGLNAGAIL